MEKDLISIIVPVYNNEKFLTRCINSILIQTYKNFELIIIDDGSTDKSGQICDKYKLIDNRVQVYHIKNKGVSNARNYALEKVKGKYICFIDSDDYVEKDYLKVLYTNIVKSNADISICGHNIIDKKIRKFYTKEVEFIKENNPLDILIRHKYFKGHIWDKMYKYELIKNVKFPNINYYEDLEFNYNVFKKAKKIIYNSIPLYNYCKNDNSLLNSKFNSKKFVFIDVCEKIKKYYIKNNYDLININSLTDYLYICTIHAIALRYNKQDLKIYKDLIKYIRKNIFRIIMKDKMSFKHKLAAMLMSINKGLYRLIF